MVLWNSSGKLWDNEGILVGYFGSSILHPCTPHTHWMTPWKHSPGRAHQLNPKYTPHIHFVVLSYIWENVPLPTLVLKVLPLWASDSIEQNRRWQPATNVTASKKSGRQEVTHLRKGRSSTAGGGTTAYCVVRHCWLAPIIYWGRVGWWQQEWCRCRIRGWTKNAWSPNLWHKWAKKLNVVVLIFHLSPGTFKKWNFDIEISERWDFGEMAVGKRDAGGGGVISWGGRGAVRQGRDKSGDISHIVTAIWPHADDLHEKSETELKTEIQLIWPKIRAQKNVANVQHWEDYWRRDGWTSTYLCRSHSLISFSN